MACRVYSARARAPARCASRAIGARQAHCSQWQLRFSKEWLGITASALQRLIVLGDGFTKLWRNDKQPRALNSALPLVTLLVSIPPPRNG